MDKNNLMLITALAYCITDVRVHLFTLINLLVEKNIISANEFYEMQKKCEVKEGMPVMEEIRKALDAIEKKGGSKK